MVEHSLWRRSRREHKHCLGRLITYLVHKMADHQLLITKITICWSQKEIGISPSFVLAEGAAFVRVKHTFNDLYRQFLRSITICTGLYVTFTCNQMSNLKSFTGN